MTLDDPKTVGELKRALEAGDCFRASKHKTTLYFEFVETVGPVRTEVWDDDEPHTTAAADDELRSGLRWGLEPIDHDDIPT